MALNMGSLDERIKEAEITKIILHGRITLVYFFLCASSILKHRTIPNTIFFQEFVYSLRSP
uniref:Uncharacterized protein n=1 Tax=Rhizophora mucronata TaxID=61149 RepID=A0A2P2PI37_RHIMU